VVSEERTEVSTENQPNWEQFLAGINQLNETVTDLREGLRNVPDEKPAEKPTPATPVSELAFPDNFDELSPKEQHLWMTKNWGERLTNTIIEKVAAIVKPTQEAQAATQEAVLTESYTRQIEGLMAQHNDFADWQDEMVAIVNENPGITPLRAYRLAKAENPDKDKKLDAKYNPPPEKPKSPFSFVPGGSGGDNSTAPAKVDNATAFKKAWEKTNAKFPGVLPSPG
jgi:hypothetical protein